MKIIFKKLIPFLIIPILALSLGLFSPIQSTVMADTIEDGALAAKPADGKTDLFGPNGVITVITKTALFLVGAISVIMLIYGGVRYTLSGGDSTAVGNAKNTILYSIVGVIVSLAAFAIVQFVVNRMK